MNELRRGPRAWLDSLLGICLTVLVAAFVLHLAVDFLRRDWPWIAGIGAAVAMVAAWLTWRRRF